METRTCPINDARDALEEQGRIAGKLVRLADDLRVRAAERGDVEAVDQILLVMDSLNDVRLRVLQVIDVAAIPLNETYLGQVRRLDAALGKRIAALVKRLHLATS